MFSRVVAPVLLMLVVLLGGLIGLRVHHDLQVSRLWDSLRAPVGATPFVPSMVAGLPAPAQRYLLHAIAPGTLLARSVVLGMRGRINLGPGGPLPFNAREILAPPDGLIWRATVGSGLRRISGEDRYTDGHGGMRWYVGYVIPLVSGKDADVSRSAAGRVALEAAVFQPAALLPVAGARWEAVDGDSARVQLRVGGHTLTPVLTVAADGSLRRVRMLRWDSDGPGGRPGEVPWTVDELGAERRFGGYTIPTRARVGRWEGTPRAQTVLEATVDTAVFH